MATKDDVLNLLADSERPAGNEKATRESLLQMLDDGGDEPAPIDPKAQATRDDLIRMLDAGEAEILPPRPTSGTHRGTGIETSALPEPPTRRTADPAAAGASAFGISNPTAIDVPPPDAEIAAARVGVLYDQPAPAGHALASLALNDEQRAQAYRAALSQHYGRDIPVEVGPETGALEYLDPKTGRFALVSPPRMGAKGVQGAAGGTMVMVPELMGGAVAAILTKSPALTTLGGAAGAVVGEVARIELGHALGINQDATAEDVARSALAVGGESAAVGFGFDKAVQLAQFMRNAFKGDAVGFARLADRIGIDPEEAAAVQAQVNDALAAERMRISARNADLPPRLRRDLPTQHRFSMTLGEASGNPNLLAMQDEIASSRLYQARFGEFSNERQRALVDFYDQLSLPFTRSPLGDSAAFEAARDVAGNRLHFEQMRANEHMARYQADANLALESVDSMPVWQLGGVARGVGAKESQAFHDRADALANEIRTLAGDAPFIENKNLSQTLDKLDTETRQVIFDELRKRRQNVRGIPERSTAGGSSPIVGPGGKPLQRALTLHPLFNPASKWTFGESWSTASELKRLLREKAEGGATEGPDAGALQQMIGAIEHDLYEAANQTELGPMYRDFTRWYRRERRRLDEGAVGAILKREGPGGRYVIADEKVFNQVFPATTARGGYGISQTREFMELIKNDPEAIEAFRHTIADDWRRHVTDPRSGRVDPRRHAEWMRMHEQQLSLKFPGLAAEETAVAGRMEIADPLKAGEPLFTAAERRAINRGEGFEKALQAAEAKRDEVLGRLNKSFDMELSSLKDMGQLLNLVRKDLDGAKARNLVQILNQPATVHVLRGVRAAYLKDMREKVMKGRLPATQEPVLKAEDLSAFLYGKSGSGERGQIGVLRELFGREYVNGMTTLEKALSATARESAFGKQRSETTAWRVGKLMTRIHFGVISKASLMITGAQRLQRTAADAIMARAIMNPADMKRLMSIWNTDVRTRKAAVVLGQFGATVSDD